MPRGSRGSANPKQNGRGKPEKGSFASQEIADKPDLEAEVDTVQIAAEEVAIEPDLESGTVVAESVESGAAESEGVAVAKAEDNGEVREDTVNGAAVQRGLRDGDLLVQEKEGGNEIIIDEDFVKEGVADLEVVISEFETDPEGKGGSSPDSNLCTPLGDDNSGEATEESPDVKQPGVTFNNEAAVASSRNLVTPSAEQPSELESASGMSFGPKTAETGSAKMNWDLKKSDSPAGEEVLWGKSETETDGQILDSSFLPSPASHAADFATQAIPNPPSPGTPMISSAPKSDIAITVPQSEKAQENLPPMGGGSDGPPVELSVLKAAAMDPIPSNSSSAHLPSNQLPAPVANAALSTATAPLRTPPSSASPASLFNPLNAAASTATSFLAGKVPVRSAMQTGGFLRKTIVNWFEDDDEMEGGKQSFKNSVSSPADSTVNDGGDVPRHSLEELMNTRVDPIAPRNPYQVADDSERLLGPNNANLTAETQMYEEAIKSKLEVISRLHEQIDQLKTANKKYLTDSERLKVAVMELREQSAIKDKSIAEKNEQLKRVAEQTGEETRNRFQRELDELISEKDLHLAEVQNNLKQRSKECELLNRQLDDLNGESASVVATARKHEIHLQGEVAKLSEELQEERRSGQELKDRIEQVTGEFGRERQKLYTDLRASTGREETGKFRFEESAAEIVRLREELNRRKEENQSLKQSAIGLESLRKSILESGLIRDSEQLNIRSSDYGSWVRALRGSMESYRARLNDCEQSMEAQLTQINALVSEVESLKQTNASRGDQQNGGTDPGALEAQGDDTTGSSVPRTRELGYRDVPSSVNSAAAARVASLQLRLASQQERDEGLIVQNEILKGRVSTLQMELQHLRDSIGVATSAMGSSSSGFNNRPPVESSAAMSPQRYDLDDEEKGKGEPPVLYYEKNLLKGKVEKLLAPVVGRNHAKKTERVVRKVVRKVTRSHGFSVLRWHAGKLDAKMRFACFLVMKHMRVRVAVILYIIVLHYAWLAGGLFFGRACPPPVASNIVS